LFFAWNFRETFPLLSALFPPSETEQTRFPGFAAFENQGRHVVVPGAKRLDSSGGITMKAVESASESVAEGHRTHAAA
jgi:hypothetical protein